VTIDRAARLPNVGRPDNPEYANCGMKPDAIVPPLPACGITLAPAVGDTVPLLLDGPVRVFDPAVKPVAGNEAGYPVNAEIVE
jgi:hypothetical protein